MNKATKLWVVIPFYNETKGISSVLEALAHQTDTDFTLLLVDNASTDNSAQIVRDSCTSLDLACRIIHESQKGTGAAADTGFRYAIAHGAAFIARTDADCLPAPNWIEQIKRGFANGLEFMGGRLKPRGDDIPLRFLDHLVLPTLITLGVLYGKLFYRGEQFKYPFFMAAGNNMAIAAKIYEQAGGFKRTSISDTNEDTELAEVVRTLTTHAKYRRDLVVYTSIRRVRKYGYLNTLRWYSGRHYRGEVDIR